MRSRACRSGRFDDTFDAVHGGQQLRLINAHYDEYGFQPIVVFDGEGRMITALLRPASRPTGRQIVFWLRRLIAALRDAVEEGQEVAIHVRLRRVGQRVFDPVHSEPLAGPLPAYRSPCTLRTW